MRIAIASLLLITALPASAQIYQYTDSTGNRAYSDQPPGPPSRQIETPTPNRLPSPAAAAPQTPAAQPASVFQAYERLQLRGVPEHGALRANNGSFSVQVELQPSLQPGHRLRLLLDGQPYGQASRGPSLQLVNIDRGLHRLAVQVLDGDKLLQQSPSLSFTLLRASRP
ncbi:MAG: DUF4124 domain-containing protein [Pseudomonas sp.]|nr:DUF4124 domain-containing protein [Pseudomonas sp.]